MYPLKLQIVIFVKPKIPIISGLAQAIKQKIANGNNETKINQ